MINLNKKRPELQVNSGRLGQIYIIKLTGAEGEIRTPTGLTPTRS